MKRFLLSGTLAISLSFPSVSLAQQCRVIDADKVEINSVEYAYFSRERLNKITRDLELIPTYKERIALLEEQNKQQKFIIQFLQSQVDLFVNKPLPETNKPESNYHVAGAYLLGNVTASLLFGYWSKMK